MSNAVSGRNHRKEATRYGTLPLLANHFLNPIRQSGEGNLPAIEVWTGHGCETVTLTEPVCIVGSDALAANVAVEDPTVSHVHVIFEHVGSIWVIRDLGSRNGTTVNKERLLQQRRLRHLDEINIGRTRLVFRDAASARRPSTEGLAPPPENITRTEKRVLIELCRPILTVAPFTPPASRREIAARLYVGEQAVQAHLTRLYDKFGIGAEIEHRRVALANETIQRGVVTAADLEPDDREDGT